MNIDKLIGKLPQLKRGFVLAYHKYTGPYNPLHGQLYEDDQPSPGQEHTMLWMQYLCIMIYVTVTIIQRRESMCPLI